MALWKLPLQGRSRRNLMLLESLFTESISPNLSRLYNGTKWHQVQAIYQLWRQLQYINLFARKIRVLQKFT